MQSLGLVIISMEYGVISDDCGDSYGFEESNLPWEDAEFFRWRGDELIAVHI